MHRYKYLDIIHSFLFPFSNCLDCESGEKWIWAEMPWPVVWLRVWLIQNKSCGLGEKDDLFGWVQLVMAATHLPPLNPKDWYDKDIWCPFGMQYMSGNKIGKFICLRKMSSLESFHWCYFHETSSHNSCCKCTEICLELLEKIAFKKKANRGSIFAC